MSPVSDEAYEEIRKKYGIENVTVDPDYEFRKRLREKRAQEEARKVEEKRLLKERIETARKLAEETVRLKVSKVKKAEEEVPPPPVVEPLPPPVKEPEAAKATPAPEPTVPQEAAEPEKPKRKVLKVIEILPEPQEKKPAPPTAPEAKPEAAEAEPGRPRKRRRGKKRKAPKPEAAEIKIFDETLEQQVEAEVEAAEKKLAGLREDVVEERGKRKRRRRRKKKEAVEGVKIEEKVVKRHGKKKKKPQFDEAEIEAAIRQTMAAIDDRTRSKKRHKKARVEFEQVSEEKKVVRISEFISVADLAKVMEVEAAEIITKCFELGLMVSINQRLDEETIYTVASEFGTDVEIIPEIGMEMVEETEKIEEDDSQLETRPPVVTIMGHVDHGKTTLLDFICNTNVVASEAGGITQHIGAYEVPVNGRSITFLDTPGHEAFTAMRARGAQATDIVILVVAADDAVMPQTIEAINHAKAAQVPIIVAINKVDKPNANPEKIRKQLADNGILVESWGGKYQDVELSAKLGMNVDKLLDMILVESEVLELKANPNRLAKGVVIESRMEKGKGITATVLVQAGTLKIGDPFIAGQYSGKVRSMFNDAGRKVKAATPSMPVIMFGFDGMPEAGDSFVVLKTEREAKEIATRRKNMRREQSFKPIKLTLDQLAEQIKKGEIKQLKLILKADADGSVEAISEQLMKLSNEEVAVDIIHEGIGAITESDVLLAMASNAIIIGFHVRPSTKARELAAREKVDIRLYDIIYDISNDVKAALEGFLEPEITIELGATIEVRDIFKVPKVGMVAGCHVMTGKVTRNQKVKVYRDDKLIQDSRISSLRRFKEDVKEVQAGFDCGITLENFDDFKVNDVVETYNEVETKRTLNI